MGASEINIFVVKTRGFRHNLFKLFSVFPDASWKPVSLCGQMRGFKCSELSLSPFAVFSATDLWAAWTVCGCVRVL